MVKESRCKITVLKKTVNNDLVEEYLDIDEDFTACPRFIEGQEIIVERLDEPPEGFCLWAWADIRKDLEIIASGGNLYWVKTPGTTIAGCSDWFRPVIFKIERIEG
jgi:uncharacterized repeat protein (TIGR04076 family)